MPYIRRRPKYVRKARKYAARRRNLRRGRIGRVASVVHRFKRVCKLDNLVVSYNSATGIGIGSNPAYQFTLNSLPDYSEFVNLYDMYKITGIKLSIAPAAQAITSAVSGTTATSGFSRVNSVIDFDDNTALASENNALQYATLRTSTYGRTHERFIKPMLSVSIDDQLNATLASAPSRNRWISTEFPEVEHRGIKVWINPPVNTAASTSMTYSVYATYYLAMKMSK